MPLDRNLRSGDKPFRKKIQVLDLAEKRMFPRKPLFGLLTFAPPGEYRFDA